MKEKGKFHVFLANILCLLAVFLFFLLYSILGYVFNIKTPHSRMTSEANERLTELMEHYGLSSPVGATLFFAIILSASGALLFCAIFLYGISLKSKKGEKKNENV